MKFLIVPVEELKKFDPYWETRRKSNDGTKAIIHEEIYDALVPEEEKPVEKPVLKARAMPKARMMAMEAPQLEQEGRVYPYPEATGEEINEMDDFKSKEEL